MNGELLRIVDSIHRDKNIDQEIIFQGIESAFLTAARKFFGEEEDIAVTVDRETGSISATHNGEQIDAGTLGRISAQSAKQIMIQKIREAERDALYDEFHHERGTIVTGVVQRQEGSVLTVNIGKTEALLPRSEQMPGESYHPGERVRAIILEVRKSGQRVKIILSRTHPDFVRRLFENEIPEIAEHIIEIRAVAREAGYRTKVAVSSIDSKVDCVGACVGVRGSRIKNILDELNGERIDIIRYNESMQVMIPNALAPAQIEEVQIYHRIGRAIVLVREDQLSLAIGKRGQNVRLASKLVGIDIEIMTFDELTEEIERAESNFSAMPNASEEVVDALLEEGILSFDDLSVMEPEQIMEAAGVDEDTAMSLIEYAEQIAEAAPQETSTRSSIISAPVPGAPSESPAPRESSSAEPRVPSVGELFGEVPVAEEEVRITPAQLFGDDPPEVEDGAEAVEESEASDSVPSADPGEEPRE
jgi:N utilization substance protein A